jgi:hypothetical protein
MNGDVFLNTKEHWKINLGEGALEKFDQSAKNNMKDMNNYSKILYENFKKNII